MSRPLVAALAFATIYFAAPALASTQKETPGAPCVPGGGQGTGNPCNGNQGNPSPEGNANEKVGYDRNPPAFTIARPGNDRGAYIDQIGDGNRASIAQSDNRQYARALQDGDSNAAAIAQSGSGAHYLSVRQNGDANTIDVAQGGSATQVALADQTGNGNSMRLAQGGEGISSGVAATQLGNNNRMSLTQGGGNNQAQLTQNGSGNAMTATQLGGGNQLTWLQTGDNLSDLAITQNGGQAIAVTQSR